MDPQDRPAQPAPHLLSPGLRERLVRQGQRGLLVLLEQQVRSQVQRVQRETSVLLDLLEQLEQLQLLPDPPDLRGHLEQTATMVPQAHPGQPVRPVPLDQVVE